MAMNENYIPHGKEIYENIPKSKPLRHLYFRHANGEMTLIEKNVGEYADPIIFSLIHKDIQKRNPEFVATKTDVWNGFDNKRFYDVGSKTEKYVVF